MKIAITGGTGRVGHFITAALLDAGHKVTLLGRHQPAKDAFSKPVKFRGYSLGSKIKLKGFDALVHCAFDHVEGQYRGGEGDDPKGFVERNLDGTIELFKTAKRDGVKRAVFLSSRAVYGAFNPGAILTEAMTPFPDTLYGKVKRQAEEKIRDLASRKFKTVSFRVTGVAGPFLDGRHKWQDLFADFAAGKEIAPRVSTEVWGEDVASAVLIWLNARKGAGLKPVYNVSGFVLDRRDLLKAWSDVSGIKGSLPDSADATRINIMTTSHLRRLGWQPADETRLKKVLKALNS